MFPQEPFAQILLCKPEKIKTLPQFYHNKSCSWSVDLFTCPMLTATKKTNKQTSKENPKPPNRLVVALSAHLIHFVFSKVETNYSTLCWMGILNFSLIYWRAERTSVNKRKLSFVLICRTTFLNYRTPILKMVVGRVLMTPNYWQPLS